MVQYTLPDGSVWASPGTLMETLHPKDDGTTKTFTITGSILTGFLGSTMQLHMSALPEYNSWAAIVLRNNFPVSVAATLSHKYSDDAQYRFHLGHLDRRADPSVLRRPVTSTCCMRATACCSPSPRTRSSPMP